MVRVVGAPALVVLAPADRMVGAHRAAREGGERRPVAGLVEGRRAHGREHVADAADVRGPVVVGVVQVPVLGQVLGRVVPAVGGLVRHRLRVELRGRPGAEDVGQELPARVRLDRRADADEATAAAEVALEHGLLFRVERVAGRIQEDDGVVAAQVASGEAVRRVLHLIHVESRVRLVRGLVQRRELAGGGIPLCEDEDAERRVRGMRQPWRRRPRLPRRATPVAPR